MKAVCRRLERLSTKPETTRIVGGCQPRKNHDVFVTVLRVFLVVVDIMLFGNSSNFVVNAAASTTAAQEANGIRVEETTPLLAFGELQPHFF